MTVVPVADGVIEPSPHVVEPVAVVDGGQDRRIRPEQGLVLELEVLGQGQDDRLGA